MKNRTSLTHVATACLVFALAESSAADRPVDTSYLKERDVKVAGETLNSIGEQLAQAASSVEEKPRPGTSVESNRAGSPTGKAKTDQGGATEKVVKEKVVKEAVDSPVAKANREKGQQLLTAASDKLKSYSSVRANIVEKVTMEGHSFTARGSYLQGQNLRLRMEFAVELGGQKSSLLEICDGQILWSRHDLGANDLTQITRRDVRQILQAAQQAEQRISSADDKARFQTTLNADLGLGGLPALLAAFSRDYDIKKITNSKIDDRDVVVLEGGWNSKYHEAWLGAKDKNKKDMTLPAHVPDLVQISLDSETQFPRRVEYLKQRPGNEKPASLMTMDFTKVVFNGKVSNEDFVFIAPERPAPFDVTQMYLQRLAPPRKEVKKESTE